MKFSEVEQGKQCYTSFGSAPVIKIELLDGKNAIDVDSGEAFYIGNLTEVVGLNTGRSIRLEEHYPTEKEAKTGFWSYPGTDLIMLAIMLFGLIGFFFLMSSVLGCEEPSPPDSDTSGDTTNDAEVCVMQWSCYELFEGAFGVAEDSCGNVVVCDKGEGE